LTRTLALLLGVRAARVETARARRLVGLGTLALVLAACSPLPLRVRLVLSWAALPLARAQASLLWHVLCTTRPLEVVAARLAPDRELVHKVAWTLSFASAQLVLLGPPRAVGLWTSAPIEFVPFVAPVLVATVAVLVERALGDELRSRPLGWTWLGVQASAAWEELLFRGALCAALEPLLAGRGLFVAVAAGAFALPHFEAGRPSGWSGVALTLALGVGCLCLGLLVGSLGPPLALHGGLLGTVGVTCSHRWRARASVGLRRDRALFLVCLRHRLYVTDWGLERVRPFADRRDPHAARIVESVARVDGIAVLPRSSWRSLSMHTGSHEPSGLAWSRARAELLVGATPVGALPPPGFPSFGLRLLVALAARAGHPSGSEIGSAPHSSSTCSARWAGGIPSPGSVSTATRMRPRPKAWS